MIDGDLWIAEHALLLERFCASSKQWKLMTRKA